MSQERDVHSSPSFIVPPFAQRCFDAGAQLWRKSFKHPFVVHLLDGSLDEERFRYYQMQDARYLEAFADVCSILSTRTYDPETKLWFIDGARMAILVERSLHENYGLRLGYSSEDIAALSLSPNKLTRPPAAFCRPQQRRRGKKPRGRKFCTQHTLRTHVLGAGVGSTMLAR